MAGNQLLRADAVADLLDIPTPRVVRLAREKLIPSVRVGRQWRFDPEALEDWIRAGGAGGWRRQEPCS